MRNVEIVIRNTVAHGLNIAVSLIFAIGGARLLSVENYGELRTAMTLLPLLMIISLPGYDSAILRHSHMDKTIRLMRIFIIRMGCAAFGSVLLFAGMAIFFDRISPSLFYFLTSIGLLLPLFETATGWRNYLIGRRLRKKAVRLLLRMRGLSLALLGLFVGFIYAFHLNRFLLLPAYMIALIIPSLATFFPVALRQLRQFKQRALKGKWFDVIEKQNLRTALGATFAGGLYTLTISLDKLWVRQELGAAALASYAVLVMVPQEFSRLFDAMIPLFYRVLFFGREPVGGKKVIAVVSAVITIMVAYSIGFYFLSAYVFGSEYHYEFTSVVLSGLLFGGLSLEIYCAHTFFAQRGARGLLSYTFANFVLTVPAIVAGVAMGGIPGLLIGLTIKQVIVLAGFLSWTYRLEISRFSRPFWH